MSGSTYYVPEQSKWPILASVALGLLAYGAAMTITSMTADRDSVGPWILGGGFLILFYVIFGWFKDQIREEAEGLHSDQLDRSYRQGMLWFIFSEVMFFALSSVHCFMSERSRCHGLGERARKVSPTCYGMASQRRGRCSRRLT